MTVTVKVGDKPSSNTLSLNARKSIDGNIMIMDHDEIDIVLMPEKKKIIAFPKKSLQDSVYAAQDRFFNYLGVKGVITRESIKSGNVYGSMECEYPEPLQGVNAVQVVVYSIGKFIEEEKPHMDWEAKLEQEFEDALTDPDDKNSTELGEVPHKAQKGSIPRSGNSYLTRRNMTY